MKSVKSQSSTRMGHFNVIAGLFFVLSFAVITTLSAYSSMAAKPAPPPVTKQTPNLYISPSSGSVAAGTTLAVQIWTDSGTQEINAVQANLTYPISRLNYVGIDTTGSAFGVSAQADGGNGTVSIARGSTSALTGKQLVATVKFTPLPARGKASASINFAAGSVITSYVTNTDILAATYGGSFSL